jgi:hypothetical protein
MDLEETGVLVDRPRTATEWDREGTRRALDDLVAHARRYRPSKSFRELLDFVARFRFYAPFNAMLIHTQMEGARYVAPAYRWFEDYRREIKVGARPIVILQPKGPVMFVFDVSDTNPLPNAPRLPQGVEQPFEVRRGHIGKELSWTIENAKRDGVNVIERPHGSQAAGSIQVALPGRELHFVANVRRVKKYVSVPLRYELLLNSNHTPESRYATLVHELAHLYCGHLGTPNEKWWPSRRELPLAACEFEAESVSYLVCERLGIECPSDEYLSGYMRQHEEVPPISLDCVMKAGQLIEQMGRERLRPRKGAGSSEQHA